MPDEIDNCTREAIEGEFALLTENGYKCEMCQNGLPCRII